MFFEQVLQTHNTDHISMSLYPSVNHLALCFVLDLWVFICLYRKFALLDLDLLKEVLFIFDLPIKPKVIAYI